LFHFVNSQGLLNKAARLPGAGSQQAIRPALGLNTQPKHGWIQHFGKIFALPFAIRMGEPA
jgi:hypothetical protein